MLKIGTEIDNTFCTYGKSDSPHKIYTWIFPTNRLHIKKCKGNLGQDQDYL